MHKVCHKAVCLQESSHSSLSYLQEVFKYTPNPRLDCAFPGITQQCLTVGVCIHLGTFSDLSVWLLPFG